jgi:hypothetical protein
VAPVFAPDANCLKERREVARVRAQPFSVVCKAENFQRATQTRDRYSSNVSTRVDVSDQRFDVEHIEDAAERKPLGTASEHAVGLTEAAIDT